MVARWGIRPAATIPGSIAEQESMSELAGWRLAAGLRTCSSGPLQISLVSDRTA
jgi:hypothetical protein